MVEGGKFSDFMLLHVLIKADRKQRKENEDRSATKRDDSISSHLKIVRLE